MTSNTEHENIEHGNSLSQDISASNTSTGLDNLSPVETSINDLVMRMAALEEQLATDGCNVADVEYQLTTLQNELTDKLNGIEPSVAQEAAEIASAASDGTLFGGIVEDVLEDSAEAVSGDADSGDEGSQVLAQNLAGDLASIEPAAGDGGAAGGSQSSGFGFQSTFAAGPIDALDDVGPIDPTQLEYGISFQNEEVRPEEDEETIEEDDNPLLLRPDAVDLDESNLALNQAGSLDVDFGNDGAGVVTSNGVFNVTGSYDGIQLRSNGVDVEIIRTVDGYEGTANGVPVFTLTIDPANGDYEYNQVQAFDHADSSDPNDVITLEFGVQASDADGDISAETLTINVADDAPVIAQPDVVNLDESNLALNQTGTLDVEFGNDVAGSVTSNGDINVSGSLNGAQLQSNGVDVVINATGNGYVGTANGTTVFTLTIDPSNGNYTYNQIQAFDHADGTDSNDVISLEFGVQVTDGDGDVAATTLTINVADDAPVVAQPDVVNLDESNLALNQTGTLDVEFGNDAAGSVTSNGDINVSGSLNGAQLQSNGVDVVINATGNGYVGTANGATVLTLTIDPSNGNYTYNQIQAFDHADGTDSNDVISLEFGVQVTDGDGDVAATTLTINVADDAPVAHDDFNSFDALDDVATGNVINGLNGGTGSADDLSNDHSNTVSKVSFEGTSVDVPNSGTASIDGEFGTLEIAADGSYTYDLFEGAGQGETVYSFSKDNPPGGDNAGDIQNVNTSYNASTHEFSFSMKVEDSAQGFTVAINNGPNPKGHGGEMALFYFDATGTEPVVSVYAYNGLNTQTSWLDGGLEGGNQPSDKITTSLGADSPFTSITVSTDADGNKVMSFTLDGADIINHDPAYGPGGDWSGFSFDSSVGIWLHPSTGLTTSYDGDGYLTQWNAEAQSYYDTSNQLADVTQTQGSDISDQFEYTLVDGDGDTSTAILQLEGLEPRLIVGDNVDDTSGSSTQHYIGGGDATIAGGTGSDVLIGDVGGSSIESQTQDYNVLFIVDVSGSMASDDGNGSKISLLQDAIDTLIRDFGDYQGGDVQVHFAPFSVNAGAGASFNVSDSGGLSDAIAYLNNLSASGLTNYEAGLQSGIALLQGDAALDNAETITYFISDGEPNRFVNNDGQAEAGSANEVIGEISGSDGTNEIAILNDLSSEVIGVGIDIGNDITRIDVIDSDGQAINVQDPSDLNAVLAETNPLLKLASVGDDVIEGGSGDDIIFGDSVNTDALALEHGLDSADGAGWGNFDRLESGESALKSAWDRADTDSYIRSHSDSLAEETVNLDGIGRSGGDDELYGGDGDDVIYGQEGDDVLYGGAGNDVLVGGSGADTFMMDALNQGIDVIRDFGADEGDVLDFSTLIQNYDPAQQAIDNFVFAREVDGGTILSIDVSGNGDAGSAVDLVALEGLHNLDLQALVESGNINVL